MQVFLSLFTVGLVAMGAAASGQSKPSPRCEVTGDTKSCTRFLSCYGTEGLWVSGEARGWEFGTIAGKRNDGVTCSGAWVARNPDGIGQTDLTCTDGDSVSVFFDLIDGKTGTAIGRGRSAMGHEVTGWSGQLIREYLRSNGTPDGKIICGTREIPIS